MRADERHAPAGSLSGRSDFGHDGGAKPGHWASRRSPTVSSSNTSRGEVVVQVTPDFIREDQTKDTPPATKDDKSAKGTKATASR